MSAFSRAALLSRLLHLLSMDCVYDMSYFPAFPACRQALVGVFFAWRRILHSSISLLFFFLRAVDCEAPLVVAFAFALSPGVVDGE
ncbi:uncharacterized protein EI97DRAFT_251616 [Westerdykella ornata]|uniref:Uncharacterized protein n=1 Tax=Westerdykella ornata TaxID=318751 RepID=A0A6A6JQ37_WESOR|nr:uncharacterized protein EI97DRAFT_251616 [Westerdykella ornata]KAF2278375.1 hypothetical protein EI97DRAFT_251616 [Westerdykella ornata]